MSEFIDDCKNAIVHNINVLSVDQQILEERRICEIKEYISFMVDDLLREYGRELDAYELLSIISENISHHDSSVYSDALEINRGRLRSYSDSVSSFDRFLHCDLLLELLNNLGISISEDSFLLPKKLNETFIYVKNSFADEAYDVFSQSFDDPRVRYADNFKSAVLALDNSLADYCLLPFEESGGKRIRTVEEIIFKNDLKINSVTPVFGFDGSADMKYALISKRFAKFQQQKDDDRYLEIRLCLDKQIDLSELLFISKICGLGVYRIDTVYFDTEDGVSPYVSVVFRSENNDFTTLLVYLTLYTQNYSIVGLYKNLE